MLFRYPGGVYAPHVPGWWVSLSGTRVVGISLRYPGGMSPLITRVVGGWVYLRVVGGWVYLRVVGGWVYLRVVVSLLCTQGGIPLPYHGPPYTPWVYHGHTLHPGPAHPAAQCVRLRSDEALGSVKEDIPG